MLLLGFALATLIGVALGLLGGGGSILTVPILLYAFHLPPHEAIASSLLVVGATSVAALVQHARAGRVRFRTGTVFGLASMAAAFPAGRLAKHVPAGLLLVLFSGVMLAAAVAMMRGRSPGVGTLSASYREPALRDLPLGKIVLQGLVLGSVTGVVGAGGGFLVVPALVLLGGLPMSVAVGTSLLVIAMNSFAGFAGYATSVRVPWALSFAVVAFAVLGSLVGGRLAGRVPQAALRRGFAGFVLAMALFVLWRELPRALGFGG